MSAPSLLSLVLHTHTPAATHALGSLLGRSLRAGDVVALSGDLGAGKTTFTQGIAAGMGVTARVNSPTFTLVAEYHTPNGLPLVHADSYRLGDDPHAAAREAAAFGLDELFDGWAVVVIEWAERVLSLLPSDYLEVYIRHDASDPGARRFECTAHGPRSAALLAALQAEHSAAHSAKR